MKNQYLFLFFFITSFSFAQSIKFEGLITDSKATGLEMANVMAINKETKAMDAYAITNDKGKFLLNLKPNTAYNIKISYLGMQNKELEITTTLENSIKSIALEEGGIELDGVEIVREMPVSIKGDTIVYNTDSFKTGEERKLEDVFKKLPGFEVMADGQVQVEGKKVTKLFVNGKPFMDGDTKLGSKNIPSDAVDKVQVLRNFNEVSQMKGLENNNDDIALNIKLKKGKDKFWFGDVSAGLANDKGYIFNPKVFYYSPKTSINSIVNLNNIGEVSLTSADFFRINGGARNTIGRSGTSLNLNRNFFGLSGGDNVAKANDKFGTLNVNHSVSKKWTLIGFAAYSSTFNQSITNSDRGIFEPNTTNIATLENRKNKTDSRNNAFISKVGSKYKANDNFQLDYDVFFRKNDQQDVNNSQSNFSSFANGSSFSSSNTVIAFQNQAPVSFNQSLNLFYTQNPKSTWVIEIQHQYEDEDPFYNPQLSVNPYQNSSSQDPNDPSAVFVNENSLNIEQSRFVKTNKVDAKADYYYQISNKSILNVTAGNSNAFQTYNSSLLQILEDKSVNSVEQAAYNNDVRYAFNDVFLGLHYKFMVGKFTFNPGFSVHQYNTNNQQLGNPYQLNFSRFLPDMFARWDLKKSENITYNFNVQNGFNDINSLVEGYIFTNFNSIVKGNSQLQNSLVTSHRLNYSKYNLYNFTTIFGNISYTTTKDPVVNGISFQSIYSTSDRLNLDAENENLNGNLFYSKSFKKYYKLTGGVNASWNKNFVLNRRVTSGTAQEFIQGIENVNHSYNLAFATQFKKYPNIDLGYRINFSEQASNKFITQTPTVKLNYYFLNGLNVNWDYSFNRFKNETSGLTNDFEIMTASLNYIKKDSKFEYRIQANNLLNTRSRLNNSFSVNGFNANETIILPRFVTFILKYNI
ncbi:TonB-dependent receptor [Flavobacterium bomense]|uniref:TonB-dependent receptor n=1 Tax=Flavobacterium bomense TaxID=2497483 RepID=A0A3S0PGA7_9FLAO|nr:MULTISPECIES: carboxypeptidase-like regulatory domain-containing protein [Flavobacterium]RTY75968.1 TonB-dependent receptor [Flavobacterium sp. LS1R10]RTZ02401.1 TonB-dependent receptor [Flavobacterium bomense]RTZ04490.1 TonB-dependent receptor [Flavobacterium sp. GSP6]